MSKKKPLGDTEKTVLVGGLVLAFWLGLDALVKRAERRNIEPSNGDQEPRSGRSRSRFSRRTMRARRREAA